MSKEWREEKWGNVISLEYGKSLKGYREGTGEYRVYGSNGAIGWTNKILSKGPAVILGRKGAYRGIEYVKKSFWVIDTAYYAKSKIELDSRWLYYAMKGYKLGDIDDGSPIPSTPRSAVYAKKIKLPPLPEQKAIAHILGSLDDKIELNRQTNATLEAMAQALFRSWFVDFDPVLDNALQAGNAIPEALQAKAATRQQILAQANAPRLPQAVLDLFPSSFVFNEALNQWVPEGWEVKKFEELAQKIVDNRGKTPPIAPNGDKLLIETYQMKSKRAFPSFDNVSKMKFVSDETYNNWFRSGHPKFLDILFATVGNGIPNWCFMPPNNNQYCIAQNVVAIRAKEEVGGIFLKHLFDTNAFYRACQGIIITTAQPSIKLGHLKSVKVLFPSYHLTKLFNDKVLPIINSINNNNQQTQTLTQLRDTLLPQLISGRVRVPEGLG